MFVCHTISELRFYGCCHLCLFRVLTLPAVSPWLTPTLLTVLAWGSYNTCRESPTKLIWGQVKCIVINVSGAAILFFDTGKLYYICMFSSRSELPYRSPLLNGYKLLDFQSSLLFGFLFLNFAWLLYFASTILMSFIYKTMFYIKKKSMLKK